MCSSIGRAPCLVLACAYLLGLIIISRCIIIISRWMNDDVLELNSLLMHRWWLNIHSCRRLLSGRELGFLRLWLRQLEWWFWGCCGPPFPKNQDQPPNFAYQPPLELADLVGRICRGKKCKEQRGAHAAAGVLVRHFPEFASHSATGLPGFEVSKI